MSFKEWTEIMRYAQNNGLNNDTVINAIKAYENFRGNNRALD